MTARTPSAHERPSKAILRNDRRRQQEERLMAHFRRLDRSGRLRGEITSDRALDLFRDDNLPDVASDTRSLELLEVMNDKIPAGLAERDRAALELVNAKTAIALALTGGHRELAALYAEWNREALEPFGAAQC